MMRSLAQARAPHLRARAVRPVLGPRTARGRASCRSRLQAGRPRLVPRRRPSREPRLADFAAVTDAQGPAVRHGVRVLDVPARGRRARGRAVFNRPRAIRDHNEKFAIARFGDSSSRRPSSRATPRGSHAFIDAQGDTIVKPLDGMGGTSVFRVRADDPNRNVIVETVGQHGARTVMVAALHPGDRRRRQARAADRRRAGAVRAGAHPEGRRDARQPRRRRPRRRAPAHRCATARSPRRWGRALWAEGLLVVGLDVIGDCLTEVNVTSPTCFVEIAQQIGLRRRRDVRRRARTGVRPRRRRGPCYHNSRPSGAPRRGAPGAPAACDGATTGPPMIGILIIAHDSLAEGLARAVTHVLGSRPPQFEVLSVAATDDPHALLPAARELVKQLDTGDGVMIFSDIYGATPCNLAGKLLEPGPRRGHRRRQPADAGARVHLPHERPRHDGEARPCPAAARRAAHARDDPGYAATRG